MELIFLYNKCGAKITRRRYWGSHSNPVKNLPGILFWCQLSSWTVFLLMPRNLPKTTFWSCAAHRLFLPLSCNGFGSDLMNCIFGHHRLRKRGFCLELSAGSQEFCGLVWRRTLCGWFGADLKIISFFSSFSQLCELSRPNPPCIQEKIHWSFSAGWRCPCWDQDPEELSPKTTQRNIWALC